MQKRRQPPARFDVGTKMGEDLFDHDGMLGDRKRVSAGCLAVPAGDAGQAVGDVLDLDVEGGRIEQVEAAAGQHSLPSPGRLVGATQPCPHSEVPFSAEDLN